MILRDALPQECWGYREHVLRALCVDLSGNRLPQQREPYRIVIGPCDGYESDFTYTELGTRTRP